jgi:hypothetical protein
MEGWWLAEYEGECRRIHRQEFYYFTTLAEASMAMYKTCEWYIRRATALNEEIELDGDQEPAVDPAALAASIQNGQRTKLLLWHWNRNEGYRAYFIFPGSPHGFTLDEHHLDIETLFGLETLLDLHLSSLKF